RGCSRSLCRRFCLVWSRTPYASVGGRPRNILLALPRLHTGILRPRRLWLSPFWPSSDQFCGRDRAHLRLQFFGSGWRHSIVVFEAFGQAKPDTRHLHQLDSPLSLRNGGHHLQALFRKLPILLACRFFMRAITHAHHFGHAALRATLLGWEESCFAICCH